jgi:hypothetical protein
MEDDTGQSNAILDLHLSQNHHLQMLVEEVEKLSNFLAGQFGCKL